MVCVVTCELCVVCSGVRMCGCVIGYVYGCADVCVCVCVCICGCVCVGVSV